MSIETWKAEFYPIDASQTHRDEAIDHSLQKWLGLEPENLAKHNVKLRWHKVMDESITLDDSCVPGVQIDGSTCALCHHYMDHDWDEDEGEYESPCHDCPLYQARGGVACDDETSDEWEDERPSPWHVFSREQDGEHSAKPMIHWLKKAKEVEQCPKSE